MITDVQHKDILIIFLTFIFLYQENKAKVFEFSNIMKRKWALKCFWLSSSHNTNVIEVQMRTKTILSVRGILIDDSF